MHLTELQPDTKRNRQSQSPMYILKHWFWKTTYELEKILGGAAEDLNYSNDFMFKPNNHKSALSKHTWNKFQTWH